MRTRSCNAVVQLMAAQCGCWCFVYRCRLVLLVLDFYFDECRLRVLGNGYVILLFNDVCIIIDIRVWVCRCSSCTYNHNLRFGLHPRFCSSLIVPSHCSFILVFYLVILQIITPVVRWPHLGGAGYSWRYPIETGFIFFKQLIWFYSYLYVLLVIP